MPATADNPLRDAAAFIRGLDADAAEAMLGRLSAEEARRLRDAIEQLDGESRPSGERSAISEDGAVELQLGSSPTEPTRPQPEPESIDPVVMLGAFVDDDAADIAAYVAGEQPRAIALVLGYLAPSLSAAVLRRLPPEDRGRVLAQLAVQGEADPESLRVVAGGLSEWIERRRAEHARKSQRVATIREILAATPAADRADILRGLSKTEPEIAAALGVRKPEAESLTGTPAPSRKQRPEATLPPIPFERLDRLDHRTLSQAVATLPPRTALLALAAAPESLLARLTKGLPRATAADLRARLNRVGPTTLAEIDAAQAKLGASAARLVAARRLARRSETVEA